MFSEQVHLHLILLLIPCLTRHPISLLKSHYISCYTPFIFPPFVKVFESIRISVEVELENLNLNLSFQPDPGLDQPRSVMPRHRHDNDHDSSIAVTAQKSFDDCCSSVGSGEVSDTDAVEECFSSSPRSASIPTSLPGTGTVTGMVLAHVSDVPACLDVGAESSPLALPVNSTLAQHVVPPATSPSTSPSVAEEVQRLRTLQVSSPYIHALSCMYLPPSPTHPHSRDPLSMHTR